MFLALNASFMLVIGVQRQFFFSRHIPGVQRQNVACFWRSTPVSCSLLALNASQMLLTGVERQSVLPPGCDFSSAVFDSVFNFYIFS